ncbi:ANR39 protein, partial [Mesembrinibis cayennensis]|nr:ANR39 protein [Mesembrinibis cayennensis]
GIWSVAQDRDEPWVLQLLEQCGEPSQPNLAGHTAPVQQWGFGGDRQMPLPVPPPQHYASCNRHLGVCRLLLQQGTHCDTCTPSGATPLHRASYCSHLAVARLLLAHGTNPATANKDGRTSLHKLAEQGHRELCTLLLWYSPALAGVCDAKGQWPRDVADLAVQDLLNT